MSMEKIKFVRLDSDYPNLETVANDIADFLNNSSPYILQLFSEFTRHGKNVTLKNYKDFVQRWFSTLVKNKAADILKLRDFCLQFFSVCNNNDEIKIMRGLVPEKLFEKVFEIRHHDKNCKIEYGAEVIINGNSVRYVPEEPYENASDSDKKRRTVDAGFWDGSIAEFAEIKLMPEAYHTKEINYLRLLASELEKNNISYQIFLIALGNKDLIEHRLRRLNFFERDQDEFLLIGKEELFLLKEIA